MPGRRDARKPACGCVRDLLIMRVSHSRVAVPSSSLKAAITVFGAAVIDRLGRSSAPLIAGSSNPGLILTSIGGVGFNMARGLARLGVGVRLIARVGRDADGAWVRRSAEALGIDVAGLSVSDTLATGQYLAIHDADGELAFGMADMAIQAELDGAVLDEGIGAATASPLWIVDTNAPAETLERIGAAARAGGNRLAVNAISARKAPRAAAILGGTAYLFCNRAEAAVLSGRPAEAATLDLAGALLDKGVEVVILTDGARPATVATASGVWRAPPLPVSVADVTGAGDAVAAGVLARLVLAGAIASPDPVLDVALADGLAAAALAVEWRGADVPLTAHAVAARAALFTVERTARIER